MIDRREELTNDKEALQKGTFFKRIMLIDIFGFADHDKRTYGVGYNLILLRDENDTVNFRDIRVAAAKVAINDISGLVEKFTPNLDNQELVADQMVPETPTELYYEECTVFRKRTLNNGTWTFELGIESGKKIPSWVIVGFMESDKYDEQTRDNSASDWLPVSFAVCRLGSGRYPDNYKIFDYPKTNFHECYYGIENFFLKQTEDRVIKLLVDINLFRRNYNFYVFDISNKRPYCSTIN